mmetsp:Transcript_74057/g.130686  ORF Transcript_74057/g.130686 Transcript_74057/m.130686 type:complete len:309 (+) Transcript_74057:247-1173(+)
MTQRVEVNRKAYTIPALAYTDAFRSQTFKITIAEHSAALFPKLLGANNTHTFDGRNVEAKYLKELHNAAGYFLLETAQQAVQPWLTLHENNLFEFLADRPNGVDGSELTTQQHKDLESVARYYAPAVQHTLHMWRRIHDACQLITQVLHPFNLPNLHEPVVHWCIWLSFTKGEQNEGREQELLGMLEQDGWLELPNKAIFLYGTPQDSTETATSALPHARITDPTYVYRYGLPLPLAFWYTGPNGGHPVPLGSDTHAFVVVLRDSLDRRVTKRHDVVKSVTAWCMENRWQVKVLAKEKVTHLWLTYLP